MSWKEDLNYGLAAFGIQIPEDLPVDSWVSKLTGSPARNTAAVVAASSAIFFIAERDHNPKVRDIYDAMVYCSTCLSVGYGDIFARTPIGKILGSTLMTIGPALSGAALDAESSAKAERLQEEVLAMLKEILERFPMPDENDSAAH
jgi:voltage-gated potassium channel Kch